MLSHGIMKVFAVLAVLFAILCACSSSSSKTCSTDEESACTNTYTTCINNAGTDRTACQKCVDDYCSCYNKCGNTCDRDRLNGQCTQ